MDHHSTSYHSQGLTRGLTVLRALGRSDDTLSLAALAEQVEVPKSTLLRLLAVMEAERFVAKVGNPPSYGLGSAIFEVTASTGNVDVSDLVSPTLKELADELGFTTNLGVLQGRSVLHIAVEEPARALRIAAGGFLDHTYCTALGKMLLSTLDQTDVDNHLPVAEEWEQFTDYTITRRSDFVSELDRVRAQGYSIDDQERYRGVRCMGVLVPIDAPFSLSVSASGPAGELSETDDPRAHRALTSAADRIARLPRIKPALETVRSRWGIA